MWLACLISSTFVAVAFASFHSYGSDYSEDGFSDLDYPSHGPQTETLDYEYNDKVSDHNLSPNFYDDYYDNYESNYRNRRRYQRRGRNMAKYQKSYPKQEKKEKVFVPVVIKKKKKKKMKIISVHAGFYIPGGTQMFGKFKDFHSCQKACEITPTCFGGDFNPWLGKCYLHSNQTACQSMKSHKAIKHFRKVPCNVLESPRGLVSLGGSIPRGIQMKGVKDLSSCIKKCANAGNGVASTNANVFIENQLCCAIDYDFGTHKCFFHPCPDVALVPTVFCPDPVTTPLNLIPNPSSINIVICPMAAK